jgi:hypothetical protein
MSEPRKIDLNLSPTYFSKPMSLVSDWLDKNTASLRASTEPQIILRVRGALGSQISVLNDGDISALIKSWAQSKGIRLPGTPAGDHPLQTGEIITKLKKLFGAIPTEVNVNWRGGSASITVSGATLNLRSGKVQYSVGTPWSGALDFKTQVPGAVFAASLSSDKWKMSFTIGKLAPDISKLEDVFKSGEKALRGAIGDLDRIDWHSASKTKEVFSPYLDPIKNAVDAAVKAAAVKPGDVSFGIWVEGPTSGGPQGVSGGLRLTIVF